MKRILKYPLEIRSTQDIRLPKGAVVLTAQMQKGVPCIWVRADLTEEHEPVLIFFVATGEKVPIETDEYLGTIQEDGGTFIWHIYMRR